MSKILGYSPTLKDGYDLRDLCNEQGSLASYRKLLTLLEPVQLLVDNKHTTNKEQAIEPIARSSFEELCVDWGKHLHFSKQMRDSLCIALSTVVSTELPGEQLWFRFIGPGGSGKTTVVEAITAAQPYVFPVSIQTGFHSGYVDSDRKKKDSSLIPKMNNRCCIIKDGDTLLKSSSRDRILSELRDIYDRVTRNHYRNFKEACYEDLSMSLLICGTNTLRSLNRSSLGERFLDCVVVSDQAQAPILKRAIKNQWDRISNTFNEGQSDNRGSTPLELKQTTYGYIKHLMEKVSSKGGVKLPPMPKRLDLLTEALGQFVVFMRCRKDRESEEKMEAEFATRVCGQLTKLAACLFVVLNKKTIDEEIYTMLCKVALDSSVGHQLDIVTALYNDTRPLNYTELHYRTRISISQIKRTIPQLIELDLVEGGEKGNNSDYRGRNTHTFKLTGRMKDLCKLVLPTT